MKLFDLIDREVELADPGPELKQMSTMDLSDKLKLFPDYLKRRAARRKARQAKKEFHAGQIGNDVY